MIDVARTVGFAAWLGTMWFAAASLDRSEGPRSPADAVRDTLLVTVGGAFVLGLCGILTPWALVAWPLCIAAVALATRRDRSTVLRRTFQTAPPSSWLLQIVVVSVLAWPGLVRPILDGDSMSYHLPNAAAWATAHSVWTATTTYWWYPPGSELTASAVLLIGGPRCLGVIGFSIVLLLALRLAETFRTHGCATSPASLAAVAIVTVPLIAVQTSSLQNDVWLAAWLLEGIVAARRPSHRAALNWAVAAISKPIGFVFAFVGGGITRASIATIGLSAIPLATWIARDAMLRATTRSLGVSESSLGLWESTIAVQGLHGIVVFATAIAHQGFGQWVMLALVLASPFAAPTAALRMLPLAYLVLFFFEPFGYANELPQLATGSSLRYALPALVAGSLSVTTPLKRFPQAAVILGAVAGGIQMRAHVEIFWNDANVRGAFVVGGIVMLTALLPRRARSAYVAASLTGLLCYATRLDNDPARYADATISRFGATSRVFDWIAAERPPKIVAWETDGGLVTTVSPASIVLDAAASDPCRQARDERALLILTVEHDETAARRAQLFASARQCGRVAYEDAGAIAIDPRR